MTAATGLVLGAYIGLAIVLFNPVGRFRSPAAPIERPSVAAVFSGPAYRGMDISLPSLLGLASAREAGRFNDPALAHARVAVQVLGDPQSGEAMLAVRLSAVRPDNNFLAGRLGMVSAWNLFKPGRGSVFMTGAEDYWPLFAAASRRALTVRGFAAPAGEFLLNGGASDAGVPRAIGVSGDFAGMTGRYRETVTVAGGGIDELHRKLEVYLSPGPQSQVP